MKWVAVAALAIAALAPGGARAGVVVAAPAPAAFDLAVLSDGVDQVLDSVDPEATAAPGASVLPMLSERSTLALTEPASRRADAAARINAAYAAADAASLNDPVPEPTTWLMMILGFFGLSFAVRRRGQGSGNRVRFS